MATQTENDRRETLRVKYAAVTARDIALGQWRFQAMLIFLTAVVLIADHVKTQRLELAAPLGLLASGMWILDLRNRALVWDLRADRQAIEYGLDGLEDKSRDRPFRLVSHTTVFDISYGGVFGYALSLLLLPTGAWWIKGAFALVVGALVVSGADRCKGCIQSKCGSSS